MVPKKIHTALISVFNKDGLEPIINRLNQLGVEIYSTGGTQKFIEGLGVKVTGVESLTSYPSILDGRVKTLHPKVFGGILARREPAHREQLEKYAIPEIDLVIVDLYPFEETVAGTNEETAIIEKIDIGGIALIRAAAKNFRYVAIVPSKEQYDYLLDLLTGQNGETTLEQRKLLAAHAFQVSSHYDTAIFNYFNEEATVPAFKKSLRPEEKLRYGENPHQEGSYFGNLDEVFENLGGKAISYNNLVDIDAAIQLMSEFQNDGPTFAVLKHTNPCGLATRPTILEAWKAAFEGDSISAFGGILIANRPVDLGTAQEIDKIFYEVLLAPDFEAEALEFLKKKKKRVLLKIKKYYRQPKTYKSILNGLVEQDTDQKIESQSDLKPATNRQPTKLEIEDLIFANKCVKHLKSNAICLVKNKQLVGMGCGQTSRVDALKQAVDKAGRFNLDLVGGVMASDAFFPFPDCVEIADQAGIRAVVQPGGSIKDQDSIDYCNEHGIAMVMTGVRHFRH